MAAELVIKSKDTFPFVEAQLTQHNPATNKDEAINLTGVKEVRLIWKNPKGETKEGKCEVTSATKGEVTYKQKATDFEEPGTFGIEWVVEWEAAKIQHVPNEGFDTIEVQPAV